MKSLISSLVVMLCTFSLARGRLTIRADGDPVRLGVYYESLCPDSMAFVRDQLGVVYPELSSIMAVDINAYGKATDVATEEGGYEFTCQHGRRECIGNIMLACAKKYIPVEETYVNFNICVMSSEDPPTAGEDCAATVGVAYDDIAVCSDAIEGQQLLHDIGIKTFALDPVLDYVPWMVLNDEHTAEIQQGCEFGLLTCICDAYTGTDLPAACQA